MPCRSDYLDPTQYENEVRRTASLLLMVLKKTSTNKILTQNVKTISNIIYPTKSDGDMVVSTLCAELHNLKKTNPSQFDEVVYGRNKEARELANWWEDHEKADNIRINKDAERRDKEWEKFYNDNNLSEITSSASMTRGVIQWFIDNGYEVPKKSKDSK